MIDGSNARVRRDLVWWSSGSRAKVTRVAAGRVPDGTWPTAARAGSIWKEGGDGCVCRRDASAETASTGVSGYVPVKCATTRRKTAALLAEGKGQGFWFKHLPARAPHALSRPVQRVSW